MTAVEIERVTVAIIGCGQRGKCYAGYARLRPDLCKVVAIAEPLPKSRKSMASTHAIDESLVFSNWKDLYAASSETIKTIGKRLADAVVVAVQDSMHAEVVLAFAKQGYHILCEKPMATTVDDCIKMTASVKKAGIIFGLGHVLRYSPYTNAMREVIDSGRLGELVNVVHLEPVGHYHFAHSFVRGNWGNEGRSSFSLMTKSCHDVDLILNWFGDDLPTLVSSFGSLRHFNQKGKPAGAGDAKRCLDCPVERDCPYSAKKLYLDNAVNGYTSWPLDTLVDGIPDIENITEALKTGPYGKCAYETDNDVVDNQVVNIQFESGATCSFTMVAFTSLVCSRQTRLHFTHGEIVGDMRDFTVTDFRSGPPFRLKPEVYHPGEEGGGHGGGDLGLMRSFIDAVRAKDQTILKTNPDEILRSHLTVFAAETSRREGKVVDLKQFHKDSFAKVAELL